MDIKSVAPACDSQPWGLSHMTQSDRTELEAPSIQAALAAVMADVTHVGKEGKNTHQNYRFRGIDGVLNACGPALRRHGVIVLPHLEAAEHQVVEVGKNRTPMQQALLTVRYVFHGPAGDSIDCVVAGEAMDSGDKATSKAMSVAFRTALIQALSLPTDEPDPDEASYERAPAGRRDISPPAQPPRLPSGVSPIDKARRALNGDTADEATVDTDGLKVRLNGLDAMQKGRVKAALAQEGFPTTLPDRLPAGDYAAVVALVDGVFA